ncbi:gas vesicle protein GvpC [Myroides pelagicus]
MHFPCQESTPGLLNCTATARIAVAQHQIL